MSLFFYQVCSDTPCFIPNIDNLCLLSSFLKIFFVILASSLWIFLNFPENQIFVDWVLALLNYSKSMLNFCSFLCQLLKEWSQSLRIIMDLSIPPFSSIRFISHIFPALLFGAYTHLRSFCLPGWKDWPFHHYTIFLNFPSNLICLEVFIFIIHIAHFRSHSNS